MAGDPYRSRHDGSWELAPRQDPVRWGALPGPLSQRELERFEERGFLVLQGLFGPAEVERVLARSHALAARMDPTSDEVIREPDSHAIRSIFRMHRHDDFFAGLADDERLAGAARQILGSDVYLHQTRVNFKPGFAGRQFYWHSDFETWHAEDGMPRMRALSASLLLTENTPVNGPLMLVPGSHRTFVRCPGATPEEHFRQSLRAQEYGVPPRAALSTLVDRGGIEQATGPAGTVILFDCNTMHGSAGNLSPFPRHNAFMVFNSVDNALVAPFGGTAPRPPFLGEREPRPLRRSA